MARKKSGRSEKKTDFWGNKYTQYYDKDGNKSGRSEERTTLFGKKYNQHYDKDGKKSRWNEQKESFLGRKYTQHYDKDNKKTGWSEKKERIIGNDYRQYYNQDNQKTGHAEKRQDFWGNSYTQYFDKDGKESYQRVKQTGWFGDNSNHYYDNSPSAGRTYPNGGGDDGIYNPRSSGWVGGGLVVLVIGGLIVVGVIVSGVLIMGSVTQFITRSSDQSSRPGVTSNSKINVYRGRVDNKYEVELSIRQDGNNLSGSYYYTKYKIPLKLDGNISGNRVVIYGYENGKLIDTFKGDVKKDHTIVGNYTRQKDQRVMPFKLNFIK
ncbi:MAG: hypothetical protein IT173_00125 [Acidobacteria bacterium]|nr:hypothetical protein [Acidobacteriota bacterium]